MKKVAVAISLIILAFVIAVLLAPFVVDLNKYKPTIVSKLKQQIHRDVDFQDIQLTILGGIGAEIKALRIADNPEFSQEDFLSLDSLQVRLEFLPLLKKQVKIKKVALKAPSVRIQKNAQGNFNFDDLVGRNKGGAEPSGPKTSKVQNKGATDESAPNTPSPLLAVFVVKDLEVRNGKVLYAEQDKAPVVVDAIDLNMQDISLSEPISIKLGARLPEAQDQNFRLSGKVGPIGSAPVPEKIPFDIKLSSDDLALTKLSIYLTMPMELRSGIVALDITAAGSMEDKISSVAKIDVKDLVVKQKSGEKAGQEMGPVTGGLETTCILDYNKQKLDIESGLLTVNGNRVAFKGLVEKFLEDPAWNMTVSSDGLDPAGIIKIMPMYAGLIPKEIAFAGPARFDVASTGSVQFFDFKADVDLQKMHLSYGELFDKLQDIPMNLACTGNMRSGIIHAKSFRLILHQLTMNGSGQVDLSKKEPGISLQVKTKPIKLKGWDSIAPVMKPYELDGTAELEASVKGPLDDLAMNISAESDTVSFTIPDSGEAAKGAKKSRSQLQGANIKIQSRSRNGEMSGTAAVDIKKGSALDVAFDTLTGRLRLTPEMLTIESFDVNTFQGNIKSTGSYALGSGTWSASPVLTNVAAGTALDSLTQFKGIFSGTLSGKFQTSGTTAGPVFEALKAKGAFTLDKGQWNNFDLAGTLLDDFSKIQGMAELLGLEKETMQRHDTTSFDSLDTSFDLSKGVVQISSLNLKNIRTSRDTDSLASLNGTADLNTQDLNLKGDVALSQKLSARLIKRTEGLAAFLNAQQRIVLPVRIKGSLNKPLLTLRTKEVNEALARYYAKKQLEKGVDKLKERFGIPGGDDGTNEAINKLLEGILK